MIGIGVTTRNRLDLVKKCVENIIFYTKSPFKLIVVDDASDKPVKLDGAQVFRFKKRVGISVAKNKCIELIDDCEHMFLFDDDCWPIKEGWETAYIDYATNSGNHHFNYIWDTFDNGDHEHQFRMTHMHCSEKVILRIPGYPDEILGKALHDITIRMKKVQLGLPGTYPHEQIPLDRYKIKQHNHTRGCMLYFDRKCIEAVGGFDPEYGVYGGAHVGFSNRIHNAGLTPFGAFLDIENSDQYFYSEDKAKGGYYKNLSVVTSEEKKHIDNKRLEEIDKCSSKFVSYTDGKISKPIEQTIEENQNSIVTQKWNFHPEKTNYRTCVFNQFFGIGDILFIEPIMRRYFQQGFNVVLPVIPKYRDIQQYFPYVQIVDKDDYHIDYENQKIVDDGKTLILPMRWSREFFASPLPHTMLNKYKMVGLDVNEFRNLTWMRHRPAERRLQEILGIKDGEKFNLVNTNFHTFLDGKRHIEVDNGFRNIQMNFLEGFTLLDWAGIIESAATIHTVNTSILFMMEVLDVTDEIHLYSRNNNGDDFKQTDYLYSKNYILHV